MDSHLRVPLRVILAALTALTASFASASIPLAPPWVIDQPGAYVVTDDVQFGPGEGIVIRATDVLLDLQGHSLAGDVLKATIEIQTAASRVQVRNGTITGPMFGVLSNGTDVTIEGILFPSCDWCVLATDPELLRIDGCEVGFADVTAFRVERFGPPSRVRISDNLIHGAGQVEIEAFGVDGGTISGNTLERPPAYCGEPPIRVTGSGVVIEDNLVSGPPACDVPAIDTSGSGHLIRGNVLLGVSTLAGIRAAAGTDVRIERNSVLRMGAAPFSIAPGILVLTSGGRISSNSVADNTGDGIRVEGDENVLEDNLLIANAGCGIFFAGGAGSNRVGANSYTSNAGGDVCEGP
jgi:parallel beta-helix repeat protein